jgi:TolA-binding protein
MTITKVVMVALALLATWDAQAATKVRDGFASMVLTDGNSLLPRNPIRQAAAGQDVYYWIQWKEPIPRSKLRCVITGPDTNIDETQEFLEEGPDGYSVCGLETEDVDAGTFIFIQYLDGEKVGERSILVEKEPFFKGGFRKRWKTMLGLLFVVILIGYWVRRMLTGDKRSLKAVISGEDAAERVTADAVAIGAKAAPAAAPTAAAKPKAPDPADALVAFKKSLAANPAFRLSDPDQVLPLAKAARAAGDPQTAVAALRGFDKAFPGHTLIPDVYVLSAKLMAEDFKNPDMAKKILQHVLTKYPGHYLAQEAKKYLQAMA